MTMNEKRFFGFSLAEALITLLVVSMVALATVPVITKKKRDPSLGAKGTWICTRNSSGQYVYWDMHRPVGDKNIPDTWAVTGKNSCEFTPQKAVKYSITVVGGGGGGGNGESMREILAKSTGGSTSFSPAKTDMYDVLLIAGGGGGGDGQSSDDNTGGGGGGGGKFEGFIPLYQGTSYTITVGGGGRNGGSEYHGGWSNSTSHSRAGSGGSTFLRRSGGGDAKTFVDVQGGEGGDGIGCSKWKCRGGDRGYGKGVYSASYYSSLNINGKTVNAFAGHVKGADGGQGANYNKRPWVTGGKNRYKDSNGNVTTYGDGGNPGYCRGCVSGQWGVGGLGVISKNWKKYGEGGYAAIPNSYFVPSLEGKLEVNIADAADPGMKGGTTIAKIMKGNIPGRTFYGYGGQPGKTDENLNGPGTGEHSQVSMKGGGAPAPACTEKKYLPGGYAPITVATKTCSQVVCNIVKADTNKIKELNVSTAGVEILPQGFVKVGNKYELRQSIGDDAPLDLIALAKVGTPSMSQLQTYFNTLKIYDYMRRNYSSVSWSYLSGHFPEYNEGDNDKTEFSGYENASEIYSQKRCYTDSYITYEKSCAQEVVGTKTITGWHEGTIQPAICKENGGNGTSFGAGGGGGNASDTAGVYSKGGKGGYGAVIIEW